MAYDEELANRLRTELSGEPGLSEKPMFGGLAFLVNGHLTVSASGKGGLLLRVDPAATDTLTREPHVVRAVMGGRTMDGWIRVEASAVETDEELGEWVTHGVRFVRTLPPK